MDDVLVASHSSESIMKYIELAFEINDNKYGPPTAYLVANAEPFQMSDWKYSRRINCDSYVAAGVQIIKSFFSEYNRWLNSGKRPHKGPLPHGYNPYLDITDECDAKHFSWFQQLIGIF